MLMVGARHAVDFLNGADARLRLGLHLLHCDAVQDVLTVVELRAIQHLLVVIHRGLIAHGLFRLDPFADGDCGGVDLLGNLGVVQPLSVQQDSVALHRPEAILGGDDRSLDVGEILIELLVTWVFRVEQHLDREMFIRVCIVADKFEQLVVHPRIVWCFGYLGNTHYVFIENVSSWYLDILCVRVGHVFCLPVSKFDGGPFLTAR